MPLGHDPHLEKRLSVLLPINEYERIAAILKQRGILRQRFMAEAVEAHLRKHEAES